MTTESDAARKARLSNTPHVIPLLKDRLNGSLPLRDSTKNAMALGGALYPVIPGSQRRPRNPRPLDSSIYDRMAEVREADSDPQERRFGGNGNTGVVRLPALAAPGFLVADASLTPFSANHEAVAILTYPGKSPQNLAAAFDEKVRRSLLRAQDSSDRNATPPVTQFKSGRRTYSCRAFLLNEGRASTGARVLIVFERRMPASFALSQISHQFHLTQREEQAVVLLLEGLGNKEIADRMGISANTVKAFLRLIMIKMGASSRSGIVAKVLDMMLSTPQLGAGLPHWDNGSASGNKE